MTKIKIGGIERDMLFDMDAYEQIDREICPIHKIGDLLDEKGSYPVQLQVLCIMLNRANAQSGAAQMYTPKALKKIVTVREAMGFNAAIVKAINEGMAMETDASDEGTVDVTLEEIEKKETRDG